MNAKIYLLVQLICDKVMAIQVVSFAMQVDSENTSVKEIKIYRKIYVNKLFFHFHKHK